MQTTLYVLSYTLKMVLEPSTAAYMLQKLCSDFKVNDLRLSAESIYSTLAAASASREMITRYLEFRGYHRSPSSRGMDDKCFMASITLLFAHLGSHRLSSMNVLEHQRCHDLGIIERVIAVMKEISILNDNPLATAPSHSLNNLLETEAHAADGLPYHIRIEGTLNDFQISVPYCGNIRISRQIRRGPLIEGVWNPDVFDSASIATNLLETPSTLAITDRNLLVIDRTYLG